MYYYKKNKKTKKTGGGLLDSFINAVTSEVVKNASKQVATKALTEVGSRASEKVINKILPRKGNGLVTEKSKAILGKYAIPIQDYVRK